MLSHQLLVRFKPALFLALPLILSAYTHLWNPAGFPAIWVVEGQYMQRAMQVLEGEGLHEPRSFFAHFYDHPFFGQLFLAGMLAAADYPPIHSSDASVSGRSIETLYLAPRLLMGVLAVIDTFLVYRIAEYRYNKTVAFIAAVLFAVMPITWILRKILLEPILLPFLLLSILFALYNKDNSIHFKFNAADRNIWRSKIESIFPILLSGIFLGLSIFTKVSAFAMIPLIGYLICISTNKNQSNNNKNSRYNHIDIRK
jgi:dolichyl-phosphate-mannose--protein O-mannosyl transferase